MATSKEKSTEIEDTYTTSITYNCPTRGKVTEIVVVKRYKAQATPEPQAIDNEITELLRTVTGEEIDDMGFHEDEAID